MLPELVGPGAEPFDLRFTGGNGGAHDSAVLLLVSNNPYTVDPRQQHGTRGQLDRGLLRCHRPHGATATRLGGVGGSDVSGRFGDNGGARDRW